MESGSVVLKARTRIVERSPKSAERMRILILPEKGGEIMAWIQLLVELLRLVILVISLARLIFELIAMRNRRS